MGYGVSRTARETAERGDVEERSCYRLRELGQLRGKHTGRHTTRQAANTHRGRRETPADASLPIKRQTHSATGHCDCETPALLGFTCTKPSYRAPNGFASRGTRRVRVRVHAAPGTSLRRRAGEEGRLREPLGLSPQSLRESRVGDRLTRRYTLAARRLKV